MRMGRPFFCLSGGCFFCRLGIFGGMRLSSMRLGGVRLSSVRGCGMGGSGMRLGRLCSGAGHSGIDGRHGNGSLFCAIGAVYIPVVGSGYIFSVTCR